MSDQGWVFGCSCGNEVSVKDAEIVCTTDGCDSCAKIIRGEDGFDPLDYLIGHELGWCGCGNPERIDHLMLTYLSQDDTILRADDDLTLIVAYIADSKGWTEHGGGIGGAWLTDLGRDVVARLRLHIARRSALETD